MLTWRYNTSNNRSLTGLSVRAQTTNTDTKKCSSTRCNGKHFQVCQYTYKTGEFKDADGNK